MEIKKYINDKAAVWMCKQTTRWPFKVKAPDVCVCAAPTTVSGLLAHEQDFFSFSALGNNNTQNIWESSQQMIRLMFRLVGRYSDYM